MDIYKSNTFSSSIQPMPNPLSFQASQTLFKTTKHRHHPHDFYPHFYFPESPPHIHIRTLSLSLTPKSKTTAPPPTPHKIPPSIILQSSFSARKTPHSTSPSNIQRRRLGNCPNPTLLPTAIH
ncbi:hypothetical protein ONS95_006584 [Cadophora gregata]|uniref:uncharacterized protein n=1 Tax=Cadophora gregata TaxID=51156 RepID=UPI0026DD5329|nr:uncharacterized protein ONS95_006584 [Cadophora gregata]KAK0101411.1 hypothetical protein ONS95_006584 [Cadophora gregata]KAK0106578.1 hypothetical protein ONS96_004199 [Cadophora gregata f. sp. sojae]